MIRILHQPITKLTLMIALILCAGLINCDSSSDRPADTVDNDTRNLLTYLEDYTATLNKDPSDFEARYGRGVVFAQLGRYDSAIADYDRALTLKPEQADLYYNRGLAYAGLGDTARALADLDTCLQINPRVTEALLARGNIYHRLKDFYRAINDLSDAIRISPRSIPLYISRGDIYFDAAMVDMAIGDYRKVLQIEPWHPDAWYKLAGAFEIMGMYPEALSAYKSFVRAADESDTERLDYARKRIRDLES